MDDYINPLAQYITTQQQMQGRNQQTDQERQAAALIEALRAPQSAPAQSGGRVVSATTNGSGLAQGAQMGSQLGQLGKGLYNTYQGSNLGTANRYGTDMGSQQTGMLQAQDAAFYS